MKQLRCVKQFEFRLHCFCRYANLLQSNKTKTISHVKFLYAILLFLFLFRSITKTNDNFIQHSRFERQIYALQCTDSNRGLNVASDKSRIRVCE